MKFHQLPIGTRFEFEGRVYVKTGPIAAATETGGQRMIPRHAVLRPLDGALPPEPPRAARKLDENRVLAAFEVFYGECLRHQDETGRLALAAARARFLAELA